MAVGTMGMSLRELRLLKIEEFEEAVNRWMAIREADHHDRWERMRMLASIVIAPHTKKTISPRELLPFPWDTAEAELKQNKPLGLDKESQRQRFVSLMARRG